MKISHVTLFSLALFAFHGLFGATLITDSFPTNFGNFTVQNTGSADGFVWSASNGVGGVSGRIDASGTGNHNDSVYYSGSGNEVTKNTTDTFSTSVMFLTDASITSDIAQVQAGFLRSTGSAFNIFAGGYSCYGELRNDGGGTYLRIYQTGGQVGSNSDFLTLNADTWYELRAFIKLDSDAVAGTMAVALYNRGADGTGPEALVEVLVSSSVALTNGGFTGNIWTGFGGGNNSGSNIVAFDDYEVADDIAVPNIPTPPSTLLYDGFNSGFVNFTVQNTGSADGFVWSASNGVGGVSGRIDASGTGNHNDSVYYSGSGNEVTKNTTDTFSTSVMFLTDASITSDIAQVQAGFLRSTGSAFNIFAGGYSCYGELRNDGGGTYLRIYQTGGQVGSNSDFLTLSADTWYELRSFIKLDSDAVAGTMAVALYNRGADGTGPEALVEVLVSSSVALTNGGFSGNIWTGFGGGNNSGSNIIAFDDYKVADDIAVPNIPTPPSTLLYDGFNSGFGNFTADPFSGADGLAWSASSGVAGFSGRIDASGTGNHNDSVRYSGSGNEVTKNTTDTFSTSVMFLTDTSITGDLAQVQAGFLRSTGSSFNTAAGGLGIYGQLRNEGSGTFLRILQTGGQVGSNSDFLTLNADTWYELRSFIKLDSDAVAGTMAVALYNRGADGTDDPAIVQALVLSSVALPNGGFTGNIWTGFGGGNNSGSNIAAFDDYKVANDIAIPSIPPAGTIVDTFESGFGNFTDQNGSAATGSLSWGSDSGVAGKSGRLNAEAGPYTEPNPVYHTNNWYYSAINPTLEKNTTDTFYSSVKFLTASTIGAEIAHATTGFLRNESSQFAPGAGGCAVWGEIRNQSGGAIIRLKTTTLDAVAVSEAFTLSPDTWYEARTEMHLDSDAQADITVFVYDCGVDGTATPSLVKSVSVSNQPLLNGGFNGASIWTGFGGGNYQGQNYIAFDNYMAGTVSLEPVAPVLDISVVGANLEISCSSESGFTYQLKESTALGSFTNVAGQVQGGTGGILTFTVPAPTAGNKKFHVVEVTAQ